MCIFVNNSVANGKSIRRLTGPGDEMQIATANGACDRDSTTRPVPQLCFGFPQRPCCALKRLAFIRFPQIFISHQRRVWFLLVSTKSQRHSAFPHSRN